MVDFNKDSLSLWLAEYSEQLSLDFILSLLMGLALIGLLVFSLLRIGRSQFVVRLRQHRTLKRAMKQACLANNAPELKALLLTWFALHIDTAKPLTLSGISAFLSDGDAVSALKTLDRVIYASNNIEAAWDGLKCWKALSSQLRYTGLHSKAKSPAVLPSLYPHKK